MNLEHVKKIYFVGMGGIGMSAAAGLARQQGFEVAGSDAHTVYPPAKDVLLQHDIPVGIGYDASRIASSNADIYIVSSGEDMHNPEVAWLVEEDKPYFSFCELLYELSKDKLRIVVAGTHGKSTTAGLLGHELKSIDDSSFMVGAVLKNYDTNFHSGTGHYIVFEGDEYKSTFDDPTPKMHYYKGDILVLTNLEFDHPDVFQNLEEIKQEFRELVAHVPDDGLIIYNADNADLADVVYHETGRSFTFGMHTKAHMQATDITLTELGSVFTVVNSLNPDNVHNERYEVALPGEINIYNALATITTLRALGFQPELVQQHLLSYKGVKRRFEVVANQPIVIVDDYAHHPTAVRETLTAARQKFFSPPISVIPDSTRQSSAAGSLESTQSQILDSGQPSQSFVASGMTKPRLWAVFEPHTYSRTRATLHELAESFNSADQVLLAPMYGARETGTDPGITNEAVLDAITPHQPHTRLLTDKQNALDILKKELQPGDVVVIMAVGSFNHLAYELAESLSSV